MTLFDCQNLLVKCVAKQYVSHYANKGRIVFRAFSSILSELKLSICSARNYLNLLLQDVILHVQLSQWLIVTAIFWGCKIFGKYFPCVQTQYYTCRNFVKRFTSLEPSTGKSLHTRKIFAWHWQLWKPYMYMYVVNGLFPTTLCSLFTIRILLLISIFSW